MPSPTAPSVDAYIAGIESDAARHTVERLRETIRAILPDAEEVISYGMPAFRLHGVVVWYAAFKNHCSLFAGTTLGKFADELVGYKTSKGGIQFLHDAPLPEPLVRAIMEERVVENLAKAKARA